MPDNLELPDDRARQATQDRRENQVDLAHRLVSNCFSFETFFKNDQFVTTE